MSTILNFRFTKYTTMAITILALSFLIFTPASAGPLNTEIIVDQPDDEFYFPGDVVPITLVITDENDEILRPDEYRNNGLTYLVIWVSGPRQNYMMVRPYSDYRILTLANGFNADLGFDPETGRMDLILPENLRQMGTYTIFFEVARRANNRAYASHPIAEFQVGQVRRTFTASDEYLTCTTGMCHNNPSQHGFTDLTTCVICHTHDYNSPAHRIEHNRAGHRNHGVQVCNQCHLAVAGIRNISQTACYSCHNHCQHVGGDVDNAGCLDCHEHNFSDEWIFDTHNMRYPQSPNNFNLVDPDSGAIFDTSAIELDWASSGDQDPDDFIRYHLELSTDPEFENTRYFDFLERSEFQVDSLAEETDFWWRILAVDLNTSGTYSNQIGMFHVGSWIRYPQFTPSLDSIFTTLIPGANSSHELTIENMGDAVTDWQLVKQLSGNETEPWTRLFSSNVSQEVLDTRLEGVIFAEDRFYVAGRNNWDGQDSINMVYILDENAQLVDRFQQPGDPDSYGLKDLAWDSEADLLWGASEEMVYGFSREGEIIAQWAGPENTHNAFAWDSRSDLLWICNIASDISGYDRAGDFVWQLDNHGLRIYGMAYWADDPDNYPLYLLGDRDGLMYVYKMNTETNDTILVAQPQMPEGGRPAGAFITNQYDPDRWVLMQISNDGSDDRIDIWQLDARTEWFRLLRQNQVTGRGQLEIGESAEFTIQISPRDLAVDNLYTGYLDFSHNADEGFNRIVVQMELRPGQPPTEFGLLMPPDGAIINPAADTSITFSWETALDPNEVYDPLYQLWLATASGETPDSAMIELNDTTLELALTDLPESLILNPDSETHLTWWVVAVGPGASTESSERRTLNLLPNAVTETEVSPIKFGLRELYPSPFNSTLRIQYGIDRQELVTLKIFDLQGREIAVLFTGTLAVGPHLQTWHATDYASGLYIIRLEAGSRVSTTKALLVR